MKNITHEQKQKEEYQQKKQIKESLDIQHIYDMDISPFDTKNEYLPSPISDSVLLQGENEQDIFLETFQNKPIPQDVSKMNEIEEQIKKDVTKVSSENLIYYLKIKSQNKYLSDTDKNKTLRYLNQVTLSYAIENIFTSQLNYSSFTYALIFMLVPFYYYYPKFYSSGFWGILIGLFGLSMLFSCLQKYSNIGVIPTSKQIIFQYLPLKIFLFSLIFYFVFFVLISKINHYSLFFISIIIIYMLTTYVLRLVLLVPTDKNPFIQYRASYQFNANAEPIHIWIEKAADEFNKRFKMSLPNGKLLYQYFAYFEIKKNPYQISEFLSYLFQPLFISIFIYLFGNFLNSYSISPSSSNPIETVQSEGMEMTGGDREETEYKENIYPLPLIGYQNLKYIVCQANYILPDIFNYENKIKQILTERCFNEVLQQKLTKVLMDIGSSYMKIYQPRFMYTNEMENEIYVKIDKSRDEEELRENIEDKKYKFEKNESEIQKENIPLIQSIIAEFCDEYEFVFKEMEENENKRMIPYMNHHVIQLGNQSTQNIRKSFLTYLFSFISPWLLWNKTLGSGWLLSNLIKVYFGGKWEEWFEMVKRNYFIWKYSSMGIDSTVYEEMDISSIFELNENISWVSVIIKVLITFFVSVPILTSIQNIIYGYQMSPKYMNMIWISIFILNIVGNLYIKSQNESATTFNISYFVIVIAIMLGVTFWMWNQNKS